MKIPEAVTDYRIHLGELGRPENPIGLSVTNGVRDFIPVLEGHVAAGNIRPLEFQVVPGVGFDKVAEGVALLESKKFDKKLVVRLQDE